MSATQLLTLLSNLLENELGQYQFPNGQARPSIRIVPPQIPDNISFIPNSGVECLIYETPRTESISQGGAIALIENWQIILLQRKVTDSLVKALNLISYVFPGCKTKQNPQMPTEHGLVFEKAVIEINSDTNFNDTNLTAYVNSVKAFINS